VLYRFALGYVECRGGSVCVGIIGGFVAGWFGLVRVCGSGIPSVGLGGDCMNVGAVDRCMC